MIALFDFNSADIAQKIVKCLAVLGGFLTGFVLTGVLVKVAGKALAFGQSPMWLQRLVKFLGGLAVAILVAMIVFGDGFGWSPFGGSLDGRGKGGNPENTSPAPETQPISTPVPPDKKAIVPDKPLPPGTSGERIRVTVLGGKDVEKLRFYRLDDEPAAMVFDDLKARIEARLSAAASKPKLDIYFSTTIELPLQHPAVTMLSDWASQSQRLAVTIHPGK